MFRRSNFSNTVQLSSRSSNRERSPPEERFFRDDSLAREDSARGPRALYPNRLYIHFFHFPLHHPPPVAGARKRNANPTSKIIISPGYVNTWETKLSGAFLLYFSRPRRARPLLFNFQSFGLLPAADSSDALKFQMVIRLKSQHARAERVSRRSASSLRDASARVRLSTRANNFSAQ